MNDYAALKLTHLRREQAARGQRIEEFRDALKDDVFVSTTPSLRLRIERWLRRPAQPRLRTPLGWAANLSTTLPPC